MTRRKAPYLQGDSPGKRWKLTGGTEQDCTDKGGD